MAVVISCPLLLVFNASGKPAEYDIICTKDYYTDSSTKDCDLYIYDFFPSYSTRFYTLKSAKEDHSVKETLIEEEEKAVEINLPHNSSFQVIIKLSLQDCYK